MKDVNVFLPCRSGSERVVKKNTRPFAGVEDGLIAIKLGQPANVRNVSRIVVSTDDEEVKAVARRFNDKSIIDTRPDYLASSATVTEDIINYVPTIV